jgi:25S rRNA (uracil2634-N3)-methyltransferase
MMKEADEDNDAENKSYVHSVTLQCALTSNCIPCHYKIFPLGSFCSIILPPNQRPEQCIRAKSGEYHGLYKPSHRVLTLGDGDFSFSLCLAKNVRFSTGCLIASSHESKTQLLKTYETVGIKDILEELNSMKILTLHDVDATNLNITKEIEKFYFDSVVWNFPCVRAENGADGQLSEIDINRKLLRDFFVNVHQYLRPCTGQLHITHKTIEPFRYS